MNPEAKTLTPEGFQDFHGLSVGSVPEALERLFLLFVSRELGTQEWKRKGRLRV